MSSLSATERVQVRSILGRALSVEDVNDLGRTTGKPNGHAPDSGTAYRFRLLEQRLDTRKKEPVGNSENSGCERRLAKDPERALVHDFVFPGLSRAIPYGACDVGRSMGWVSVGIDHNAAGFTVQSIRLWRQDMGRRHHPTVRRLLVTADAGGRDGPRIRLWRVELQHLADELHLPMTVCRVSPGTKKWNKIEHGLSSFISMNCRGKAPLSYEVIVSLIAATTTQAGVRVEAALEPNRYPAGGKGLRRRGPPRQSETGAVSWRLELHRRVPRAIMISTAGLATV